MDMNIFYRRVNSSFDYLVKAEETINRTYDEICNVFDLEVQSRQVCIYKGCLNRISPDDVFTSDICCAHHTIFEISYNPLLNLVLKGYTKEMLVDILYNCTEVEPETQSSGPAPYETLPTYISCSSELQQMCNLCLDDTKKDLVCLGCSVKHVMCYTCLCNLQTHRCPYCRADIKNVFKYL